MKYINFLLLMVISSAHASVFFSPNIQQLDRIGKRAPMLAETIYCPAIATADDYLTANSAPFTDGQWTWQGTPPSGTWEGVYIEAGYTHHMTKSYIKLHCVASNGGSIVTDVSHKCSKIYSDACYAGFCPGGESVVCDGMPLEPDFDQYLNQNRGRIDLVRDNFSM